MHLADHPKYDTPEGIQPPPLYERTRRWESGPSRSRSPGPRRSRSHSNYPGPRRRDLSPPPRTIPLDDDARRPTSPYADSAAAAEDPTVQRGVRSRASMVQSRSRSPPRINSKGKGRATSSRSLSPPQTGEVISHRERTRSSESSEIPANLLRSPSPVSDIPYTEPTTSLTLSHGGRSEEASPPSPGNNNPVTAPQPRDGSAGTTHPIESVPLPSESRQPFNLSVTGPSITPESYDSPTINDDPARTNPARRRRYRNQRDSINAYLRSSSTSIPRFPTSSIQPAPLPSPAPLSGIADVMVTGVDGVEAVASATKGQGGDEGGYACLSPELSERRQAPAVNDNVRKEETGGFRATRAQSSGASISQSHLPRDGGGRAQTHTKNSSASFHAAGARARLLDRLTAENNVAAEARLRSQARLRARLAAERRLAKRDDDATAQGASGDSAPRSTHVQA
jgi:hypothetical protein